MAVNFKEMVTGATLTGSAVSYYTAPSLTSGSIQAATAYNPTGSPVTILVYKVPSAGAAGSPNLVCSRAVPAGATVMLNELINHKLAPGSGIYASGLALTMNISGVEYVPD